MTARSQGHPMFQPQTSTTQHLRDRQRFFEDVLQHDVDLLYPQLHLLRECWRPPLDSVSSMEVNIDNLEISDPLDISELDTNDAFQQCDDPAVPPTPTDDIPDTRLHFPESPTSDNHLAQDDDTAEITEEAHCEQSLELEAPDKASPDPPPGDHSNTPTSEIKP
ncbi:dysbindin domain-containing protein 2 [Discoglossus pictus]